MNSYRECQFALNINSIDNSAADHGDIGNVKTDVRLTTQQDLVEDIQ